MSPENTISLDKVVDPGIKKHFVDGYKLLKPQIDKLFKTDTQTSETDTYQNYTGLSEVAPVSQGSLYNEDTPIKSYGVALTPTKFGKLLPVTYELTKWAKVKEIWDGSNMLGRAMARKVEREAASVVNNGYNTAFTSYTDGKPLFSVSHTRADGGTAQSNASSTGIILSDDNLEVGFIALEYQLDDRGEPIQMMTKRLWVSPYNRKRALIITKSENRSGTADNDANVYKSIQEYYGTVDVMVWYYLATATGGLNTQWFLEDPDNSRLMWNWADKPNVKRDDSIGFKNDVCYYKGMFYAAKGWSDWRGLWGSKGDGNAYAS